MLAGAQPSHHAIALVTAQRKMDAEAFVVIVNGLDVEDLVGCLAQLAFWVAQLTNHVALTNGADPDDAWVGTALRVMEANP